VNRLAGRGRRRKRDERTRSCRPSPLRALTVESKSDEPWTVPEQRRCFLECRRLGELGDVAAPIVQASAQDGRERGLIVTNTPGVLTDCTADLAFLLILAACRRLSEYAAIMRDGWRKPFGMPDNLGLRANGRTLGIVGMGRIGQAVARRARGFDMRVLYHDRVRLPADQEQGAEYVASLDELLPRCEILSLHLPGGDGTLMTREAFARLPRGAVFVNTARGSLVDEDALIEALQSGHLFAAGLDVYRREPDFDLRLAALPNVFLTPHVASATVETRDAMGFLALDNIAAVLAGGPPITPV
jgi:lactate dehydrogenase-like 2-hydroxyacid dehydrogenase